MQQEEVTIKQALYFILNVSNNFSTIGDEICLLFLCRELRIRTMEQFKFICKFCLRKNPDERNKVNAQQLESQMDTQQNAAANGSHQRRSRSPSPMIMAQINVGRSGAMSARSLQLPRHI